MARCTCVKCGWNGEPGDLVFSLHEVFKNESNLETDIEKIKNDVLENLPQGPLKFPAKAFAGKSYPMQIDKRTFRYATFDALCWLGGYVEFLRGDMTNFSKEKIHYNLEQIKIALRSTDLVWVNQKPYGKCKSNTIIGALESIEEAFEEQKKIYNERKAEIDIKYFYHDEDGFDGSIHEITECIQMVESELENTIKKIEDSSGDEEVKNRAMAIEIGDAARFRNTVKNEIEEHVKNVKRLQANLRDISVEILMKAFGKYEESDIESIKNRKNLPTDTYKALKAIVTENTIKQALFTLLKDGENGKSQEILYSFRELEPRKGEGEIAVGSLMIGTKPISKRYCPECCAEMSSFAGACKEYVLTVIGNPRVSKSTGLAAAISYVKQQREGVSIETDGDNENWKQFKENYLDKYEKNEKVMATTTGQNDNGIPQFSIKVNFNTGKSCIITILDIPGELIKTANEDIWKLYGKLYKQVDYVWFCMDVPEIEQIVPGQNDANNRMLKKAGYFDDGELQSPISIGEIVGNMSKPISPIGMITADRQNDVKAMFVITKSDVANENDRNLYSLLEQGDNELVQFDKDKEILYVDESHMYNKMIGWRRYISDKQGNNMGAVWKMFERSFPIHGYCALSAYGIEGPNEGERPREEDVSQNQEEKNEKEQTQQGSNGYNQGNNPMYDGYGPVSSQSYSGINRGKVQNNGVTDETQQFRQWTEQQPWTFKNSGNMAAYSQYGQQNGQMGTYSQYSQQNIQAGQYIYNGQQNIQTRPYGQNEQTGIYSQPSGVGQPVSQDRWSINSGRNVTNMYQDNIQGYGGESRMAAQAVKDQITQKTSNSPHGYMTGWPLLWMFIMEGYMGVEIQKLEVTNKLFSKKKKEIKKVRVCADKDPKVGMNMGMMGHGQDDMYYTR